MIQTRNHHAPERLPADLPPPSLQRSSWVRLFCLVALAIAGAGWLYYHYETNEIREAKTGEIAGIARLKTDQILSWRRERILDARRISASTPLKRLVGDWRQKPGDPGIQSGLRQLLREEIQGNIYRDAFLVDTNARIILSGNSAPAEGELDGMAGQAIEAALAETQPVLGEPYRSASNEVHLDLVAAVRDSQGQPMALVFLTVAAAEHLYPIIQSWPVPAHSSETLLVRREGDEVLFLNELRFRKNTALALRLPLTQTNLPAVQAVLGRTGAFLGRDYRGVEVLADLRPVPGTAWFMVAKMDTAEVFSEARYRAVMTLVVVVALILFVGGLTAYLYRTRQLAERRRAAEVLRESEARYRRLHESMTDAYASVDMQGRIRESNRAFREMLGYTEDEVNQLTYQAITPAKWHAMEADLIRTQILPRGYSEVFNKEYQRKDGTVFPVELRTFLLRDDAGQPAAMWAIVRDITARQREERRVRHLNLVYAALTDINQTIVRMLDPRDLFADVCQIAVEKGGFRMAWIGRLDSKERRVRVAAQAGETGDYLEKLGIELSDAARGHGPTGNAICSEAHAVCNDIEHDPQMAPWRADALRLGYRASAAFPLVVGGHVTGCFNLYAEEPGFFGEEEVRLLDELAADISFALELHQRDADRQRAERLLQEERDRAQRYLDVAATILVGLSPEGTITLINREGCAILGWEQEDLLGSNWFEMCLPKRDRERTRRAFAELVAGRIEPFKEHENAIVTRAGLERTIAWRNTLVRDAAGRVLGTLSSGEDITDRIRVEAALRASEQKFRALTQQMPDFVWQKDSLGIYVSCNKHYADVLGVNPETIAGHRDEDFYPPELAAKYLADDREVIATRRPLETEEQWQQGKEQRWLRTHKVPLLDEDGRCIGTIGIGRDITNHRQSERALRESESRYRQMLGSVTDYIYRVEYEDERPRSTTHGPGCENLTGYKPEEYAANPYLWFEMIHAEDRSAVEDRSRRIAQGDFAGPLEHRIVHRDGSVRWVRNTLVARRDDAGRLVACDGMISDITERKEAERALARNEAELSAIYEHAPTIMCLLSVDGRVRRLNRAGLEYCGGSNEDAAGKGPGDFLCCVEALKSPEGCGHAEACAACPLRVSLLDTARNGVTHRQVESTLPLQRQDQTRELVVLSSTARVEVGGEMLVLLCLEDITSHKEVEARVRQQAALLDQTLDAVLVAGLDRLLRYCNRTAEQFFGTPAGRLLNQNVEALMFSGAPENCAEACRITLEQGMWSGETRAATSLGHRVLSTRWTLIRDPAGNPASFLIVNTDITEQKKLEEQFLRAQRMESIGTLASGVAHDLNNILAPIMIATEVLQPIVKGEDEEEVIDLLRKGAQRGADIVRQLLMFGRGVQGQRLDLQPRTVLKEMLKVLQETFPKSISLEQSIPENLWTIRADPTQVHQVLLNLCVNARDSMPQGGRLTLSAENLIIDEHYATINREAIPGPYVVLEVDDTGSGIPQEILHKIFDPFFTTKEAGKGTGLGLSTVLGIVKGHGGFVQVNSRLAEGTRFKVYFPAIEAPRAADATKLVRRPPKGGGELILVVDDEEAIRAVARRLLVKFGYRVVVAEDGAEGLMIFSRQKNEISAVVVDMVMPVMDGPALIRSLRHLAPELRILAMSGLAAQQAEAEKAGVSEGAFLVKPFEPDAFLSLLHRVLATRKG